MNKSVALHDLLSNTDYAVQLDPQQRNISVTGISLDSRKVEEGTLFVAIHGDQTDGHRYIRDAVKKGASAVIGSRQDIHTEVPYILVSDGRAALAEVSAAFYNHPSRSLTVIGVTGTDGKTTTTNFIYQCLLLAGIPVGMISTVNAVIGDTVLDTGFHVTTPEAPDVQRYLAQMVDAGLTHVVLEVTSHGLEQKRVSQCNFDIGVVTNIVHEHLDYHGSYQNYLQAKQILFDELAVTETKVHGNLRLAVLNADDRSFSHLQNVISKLDEVRTVTYSLERPADVMAVEITSNASGVAFIASTDNTKIPIQLYLHGEYNAANALAAISACKFGLGLSDEEIRRGIESLSWIPGRMEKFELGQLYIAVVDFAHTPNALEKALKSAKNMTTGRVIAVFGSAGLRDREKRWMMAEIAAEYADVTILTAEDPRTEDLNHILEEMEQGMLRKNKKPEVDFWSIRDRGEAIRFAISLAAKDDLVIACGKGHEQSMCFGETEYPWDDRIAMKAAISEQLGIDGPEMPYLPTSDDRY